MASEKTWRPASTREQIIAAITRAIKAMKGSSHPMTMDGIARQAARYIPESYSPVLRLLKGMKPEELAQLGYRPPTSSKTIDRSTRPTRMSSPARWNS